MIITTGKVNITGVLGEVPPCGVIAAGSYSAVHAEHSVLVLGSGARLPEKLSVFAVVADADEGFDISCLKGVAVITCGMGSRNTVSVTSKTTERITISLNRGIHTMNGLCEPLELPLPLAEGTSDFGYMAAFAALLLCGRWEELKQISDRA